MLPRKINTSKNHAASVPVEHCCARGRARSGGGGLPVLKRGLEQTADDYFVARRRLFSSLFADPRAFEELKT
jgi:hypothetical protein